MRSAGGRAGRSSAAAEAVSEECAAQMGRELDTDGIKELLYRNCEHPRWDEVSERCLTCGNCTLVCPTCFCHTVEDVTDLAGEEAERRARNGTPASRSTTPTSTAAACATRARSRYRQWMTHKLATWIDQFGTSGCVGCGRCITWCPVAIDITEEAAAIRATDLGPDRERGDQCRPLSSCSPRPRPSTGCPTEHLELIAGCAQNTVFEDGEYLMREGEPADTFYVIRHGRVALEIFVPQRGAMTIETLDEGDLLGWSWLLPPFRVALRRAGGRPGARVAFDGPACAERPRPTRARLRADAALHRR